jgi:hypothetical protein
MRGTGNSKHLDVRVTLSACALGTWWAAQVGAKKAHLVWHWLRGHLHWRCRLGVPFGVPFGVLFGVPFGVPLGPGQRSRPLILLEGGGVNRSVPMRPTALP